MKDENTHQDDPTEELNVEQDAFDKFMEGTEEREFDFGAMEMPEELAAHTPAATESLQTLPPALDRVRPHRDPVISRTTWVAIGVGLLVVLLVIGASIAASFGGELTVPTVVGKQYSQARTDLTHVGLKVHIAEKRFSPQPVGEVLEQTPSGGAQGRKGDTISLVVSAGTEESIVPDVVGNNLTAAQKILQDKGFLVVVEPVVSDAASGTVLAQMPAAGVVARSGDVIRLQVAAAASGTQGIRPYRMEGVSVMIDPAPVSAGQTDVNLEVGRRLQSLLEASGATVIMLRSGPATSTSDAPRANAARTAAVQVAVGLAVKGSGAGGRKIAVPTTSPSLAMSNLLGSTLQSQLTSVAPPSQLTSVTNDPVLSQTTAPWARVTLGSFADAADVSAFSDPSWADTVARAIYAGIGEVFGRKE